MDPERALYKRILLKLSGEVLGGESGEGFDWEVIDRICGSIKTLRSAGVQVAVVVGGGNILRGRQVPRERLDRNSADYMGMLATVMNGLVMLRHLQRIGLNARLFSALEVPQVADLYRIDDVKSALEKGEVAILAGGTGHPHFTTDTGAALRAAELGADVVLKGTNVEGVYTSDPHKDPDARLIKRISYKEVIEKGLGVMDLTAVSLCMNAGIPVKVFSILDPSNIVRVCFDESIGTLIE